MWRRRRWCIGLFGLWLAWQAALADPCPPPLPPAPGADVAAKDRGLLWRITRDGRNSWLFGTLHVGKPAWVRFGPRLSAALAASDVLALEIDPNDPEVGAAMTASGAAAASELPPALQQRLAQAWARACVDGAALAALHPVLQVTTLTVLDARWLGMDPGLAQEQLLLTQVRSHGRAVVALETAAQQKAALVPQDASEVQAMVEDSLTQLEDQSGRRVLARLAQAWESGDLAALEGYETWCECATTDEEHAFMRRLNDERNPALADGIAAQHARGRRVFAAVGALHMTGPQSLPRLLAQRGFEVQRVDFGP